jgi:hypothetical protein
MTNRTTSSCVSAVAAAVFLAAAVASYGQTPATDGAFVAGRVGANGASEPTLGAGTSVGAGGSFGFFFRPSWAVEFEVWIPQYVEAEFGSYRSVLFGVSARRHLGSHRVDPYLLVGGAVSKDGNDTPAGRSGGVNLAVQAGGGLHVRLGSRLAVEPEVRLYYMPMMAIIRPSVALVWSVP